MAGDEFALFDLRQRFAFNARQYFTDSTGSTVVGIGAKVQLFTNQLSIPIKLNQAIRIVRATANFSESAGNLDVLAEYGFLFLFAGPGFNTAAKWPFITTSGIFIGKSGPSAMLEDEVIYGTDCASVGFAPPTILVGAELDVLGAAAARTIVNEITVLWEVYDLKPDAPLRGA